MTSIVAAVVLATTQVNYQPRGPKLEVFLQSGQSFVIETDQDASPLTVGYIIKQVKAGFYDAQKFHRVEKWVVQWGDPTSKFLSRTDPRNGHSRPMAPLPFEPPPVEFDRAIVGMVSQKPGTGGNGQIFVLRKDAHHLGSTCTILGKVIVGMDVVDSIKKGDRITRMIVLSGRGF
jgi:peptidylprolyl isomerase